MKTFAYPRTVEYRGTTATIYLQKPRNLTRYEVRYYDVDGSKQRFTFTTAEAANEFAEAAVREIVKNRSNFITLRGQETYDYQEVVRLLTQSGLSLIKTVNLVLDGNQLLAGTTGILDAVRYYVDNRPRKSQDITVRQVVDELLDLKKREGSVGPLHLRDLRLRLGRFADKFCCPIRKVPSAAIRDFILEQPVSERTRHNLRTTLATLFNYAAAEGYPSKHSQGTLRLWVYSGPNGESCSRPSK